MICVQFQFYSMPFFLFNQTLNSLVWRLSLYLLFLVVFMFFYIFFLHIYLGRKLFRAALINSIARLSLRNTQTPQFYSCFEKMNTNKQKINGEEQNLGIGRRKVVYWSSMHWHALNRDININIKQMVFWIIVNVYFAS